MKENKYYIVEAKCGHVGRNKYIIKKFPVVADSRKQAAEIVRFIPRVKHHKKDAIISTTEVSYSTYLYQREENDHDLYFNVTNIQDQRKLCGYLYDLVKENHYNEIEKTRRASIQYRLRKIELQTMYSMF